MLLSTWEVIEFKTLPDPQAKVHVYISIVPPQALEMGKMEEMLSETQRREANYPKSHRQPVTEEKTETRALSLRPEPTAWCRLIRQWPSLLRQPALWPS